MQKGKSSFFEILHFCIFSNFKYFFQGLEYLRLRHSFFVPMINSLSFRITRFKYVMKKFWKLIFPWNGLVFILFKLGISTKVHLVIIWNVHNSHNLSVIYWNVSSVKLQDISVTLFRSLPMWHWKNNFLPPLIFNWRTFSRRATARWLRQWAKNQVLANQNSRNG